MNHHWIRLFFIPLVAAALVACPVDKVTGIDANATPNTIASGGTSSLTATVSGTGSFNPGVNWSITSGGGSLSGNTGASVTYTAPAVTSNTAAQIRATAAGDPNIFKTVQITVQGSSPPGAPVIVSFTATPSSLPAGGGNTTLAWNVTGATSLSINQGVGDVTGQTSKAVNVTTTKTFILTATNNSGSRTATVDVMVGVSSLQPGVWDASNWNEATWQ